MEVVENTMSTSTTALHTKETAYSTFKYLATFCKIFGAFPLLNTLNSDGKKLQHKWLHKIHLWDCMLCIVILMIFIKCLCNTLSQLENETMEDMHKIGIAISYFIGGVRGIVQFILLHIFAPKLPKLFKSLEEYHQEIGVDIIKPERNYFFSQFLSVIRIILILIVGEILSFMFISTLYSPDYFLYGWPIITLFIFSNLWQEMPMNIFAKLCMYLTKRFAEIRDNLVVARHEKDTKDVSETVEMLRLQHAALASIITQLEKCYGVQLAINVFFLLMEIVVQLYVFFVVTLCSNVMLVLLSLYYFVMAVIIIGITDRLQRTNYAIAEEISAFKLRSSSSDLNLQIQLFSSQLTARPVIFSASGYFIVNNTLVASILGSAATYLVVLIQFAPYLHDLLQLNATKI